MGNENNFPESWQVLPFIEAIDFQEGPGILAKDFHETGVPLIRLSGLDNGASVLDGCNYLDPKLVENRYPHFRIKEGDILLSTSASLGRTAVVTKQAEGAIVYTGIIRMRPRGNNLYAPFIKYLLESPNFQNQVEAMGVGSVLRHFGPFHLKQMKVTIPPFPEQRAIAGILGALDDKIEVNRRMNATLESIARAVFRQWFVENEEVKSWEIQTLQQHIEAEKGLSYKGEGLSKDGGTPMHNLNSVYEGGGYKYEGIKYYTGEYRERHILRAGDIIVTNTEQGFEYLLIGFPAIVPKHFGNTGIFTHHIFRVRPFPTSPVKTHYLYFLLMNPYVRDQIIGCTNGTTVNMLSADGLRTPKFHLPPKQLIDKFEQFAAPVFEKMELIHEESRTLGSLRDSLLPKLMRGEVRVSEL